MKLQYILLTFFGIVAVVAVVVFALVPAEPENGAVAGARGNVVIWGTYSSLGIAPVIARFNEVYQESFTVTYEFHDPKTFDREIVEALASERGPDILLLPDDLILRHADKIELISYQSMPPGVFSNLFIQAAEIYLRDQGLVALPFAIDPIVMYWNRDLFGNASLSAPPKYWDELLTMTPRLTKRDRRTSDITQSAIAFGEFANVDHAKDILALLMLQVGNSIVEIENGRPVAKVSVYDGKQFVPDQNIISALRFYMDFSNPLKSIYSWNRSKSGSLNEFINGNLAVYFDYASAYRGIAQKNPHLNFAVAPVPLPRDTTTEITFAKVHGLAVLKKSKNKQTAFITVERLLLDDAPARDFARAFNLPPVRRDLLGEKPTDAALSVFYDSAIRGRTWLDPRPEESDKAFRQAVESVSSGRTTVAGAVSIIQTQLSAALEPYQ